MIFTLIIFMNMMFISTASSQGCSTKPIDFVFLLDESASVGEANFILQNEFVAKFVEIFGNGSDLARFAVVTFATNAKIEFYLNSYLDKTEIIEKIRRINYSHPGLTMTQFALHSARTEILNVNHGMRLDALYVVIVMTDGKSMFQSKTINEAKQLHNMDVIAFAIGISTEIDKKELRGIASDPDYVFTVKDFHTLESIKDEIKITACKAILRKEKESTLTQTTEKSSMAATILMRTATPTSASGNSKHTVGIPRTQISTRKRSTLQKSFMKTTEKLTRHSITTESSNWWTLRNTATTTKKAVTNWITSIKTTHEANTVSKMSTKAVQKIHQSNTITKRVSTKGTYPTTYSATATVLKSDTYFSQRDSKSDPFMTKTSPSVLISTKRPSVITKSNMSTTQMKTHSLNIQLGKNISKRLFLIPVWFKYIEIGVISITVILGMGVLGCCCSQFCGGKRTEDEEERKYRNQKKP